ncbi:MAG: hypothetical protein M1814_003893 [Vezdaea aestivalis]|nr:MAG: hypothetical protein M1814_003893 [Vezdaea aestivalis]
MRTVLAAAIAHLSLSSIALALDLLPRSDSPSVVSLDTQRRDDVAHPMQADGLFRRQTKPISITLDNELILYYINMTIGTPAKQFRLHIDTGSSDLWVNSPNSRFCRAPQDYCITGTYTANTSSTYEYVNSYFIIRYADGSGAAGDYVKDTVTIGDIPVTGLQFGIGYTSFNEAGILGIGYAANEAIISSLSPAPNPRVYQNLPQLLVAQGRIKSNAYSLWLNDLSASQGQILFGGVNTAKYYGSLQSLPIQRSARGGNTIREFNIALTGMGISVNGRNSSITSSSLPVAVLLDSGATLTRLPTDITNVIFAEVNAVPYSRRGVYVVPCSLATNTSYLTFTFSSVTINVPYNEMVIDYGDDLPGGRLRFNDGTPACVFGILPSGGNASVLGDTFLRSAYVVYDLDNNQISLANTNFNSTRDDIREIGTGPNAVPDARNVSNAATAIVTNTGGARLGLPSATGTGAQGGLVVTITRTAGAADRTAAPMAAAGAVMGAVAAGALWAL